MPKNYLHTCLPSFFALPFRWGSKAARFRGERPLRVLGFPFVTWRVVTEASVGRICGT